MCGISGIAYSSISNKTVELDTLRKMRDLISHRGPDEAGEFVEENLKLGLGHRRLSIVDVEGGHQPMFNEDGSIVIVYNGEIYNHADYRQELESKGHTYRTRCDTEAIVHLYEEYRESCLQKLRGMFAFAIWDRRRRELFLARDRFGVKPLYYVHDKEGNLFFASEIKSLLEVIKPELNYQVLAERFANYGSCDEQTFFKSIKQLLPGCYLLWKDGKIKIEKYWDLNFEPKHIYSDEDAIREWARLFRESVRIRLMADVPLGMFLSGGIDSSAICAVMTQEVRDPIKTFSVGFDDKLSDELQFARIVAEKFKTEHYEVIISPRQFFDSLTHLTWQYDEPISFEASIPLYFVSLLASQHVKVVLTGEGSDEILAGYARYQKFLQLIHYGKRYESLVPASVRRLVKKAVETFETKLSRTFLNYELSVEDLFLDNFSVFNRKSQMALFSEQTKLRDPYHNRVSLLTESDATELLDKLLYIDIKAYLPELLMKQDKMSMAASIESRVPFLDYKLAEFTARMPINMKIRSGVTKWLLRESMREHLPAEILHRKKVGFAVPINRWLRSDYKHIVQEYVLSDRVIKRGIFNSEYLKRLADRFFAGKDDSSRIFRLITFEIWYRQFMEGERLF
jgi:asparagine synthase (glutamine-hydrolysing)